MIRPAGALVIAALLAACGVPGAPAKPPTAQEILAKPIHSNLKDAHFLATGKVTSQGVSVDVNGDGEVVYKPAAAGHLKFQMGVAGQQVSLEEITVGGTDYTISSLGNGKWQASKSTSGLGPDSFNGASAFKYVGEETLPQGKAWHASAKDKDGNPFDGWIRESDGYPLKYVVASSGTTNGINSLTLTFDKYNTGTKISAPPASEVVSG